MPKIHDFKRFGFWAGFLSAFTGLFVPGYARMTRRDFGFEADLRALHMDTGAVAGALQAKFDRRELRADVKE